MPWEREDNGEKAFKYQYHPNGDKNQPLQNAPSALNSVIVPNVTLPTVGYLCLNLNSFLFLRLLGSENIAATSTAI
jgi:hypothetical protein